MKLYSYEFFLKHILSANDINLEAARLEKEGLVLIPIPKKGGYRYIVTLKKNSDLYRLQKNLLKNYLEKLPVSPAAKGFRKELSYVDYLGEHKKGQFFLRVDIENFFGSITEKKVRSVLKEFIENDEIMEDVIELCMEDGILPQGFVTSPAISNLVFRGIDQRIRKYCRAFYKAGKTDIIYTRYADDCLFSSIGFDFYQKKFFKRMVNHIFLSEDFYCNESKTLYKKDMISLSGYVVDSGIRLSRKKMHSINSILYLFDKRKGKMDGSYKIDGNIVGEDGNVKKVNDLALTKANGENITFTNISSLINFIAGYRAYFIDVMRSNPEDTVYYKRIKKKVGQMEMLLTYLSKQEDKIKGRL